MDDAQDFGATWTNAALAGITVRDASYGHASGNDGRLVLVTGTKVAAGAVGSTTNTLTAASVKAYVTVALTPAGVAAAVTVTPAVHKAQAVPVSPLGQPGTATLTPTILKARPSDAIVPAAIGGTSLNPTPLKALAVPVAPVGTGPSSLTLTPAVARTDPVPVTVFPGQVTTTLTPATLKTQPGDANPISSITETFNKADGTLGPNLTWTRRVYLAANAITVASNRARYQILSPATELDQADLQIPAPNLGIADQTVTVEINTLNATWPTDTTSHNDIQVLARVALHTGDTDFRGYAAILSLAQVDLFGTGSFAVLGFFALGRYDTSTEPIPIGTTGTNFGIFNPAAVTFPATLTLSTRGNQIFGRFDYGATRPLIAAATDNTYSDGSTAILARIDTFPGFGVTLEFDNFAAAATSLGPETVLLNPAVLNVAAWDMWRHRYEGDYVDGSESGFAPIDIFDGGDTATPPADIYDANPEVAPSFPAVPRLVAVPLSPVGDIGGVVTLTPATLKAVGVPVAPAAMGVNEITPVPLKAQAVPAVSVVPGVVTTTATPPVARTVAVAVSPATLPGAVDLTPAQAETQTGTVAPADAGAMSIPPVTARFAAVPVTPVGVGPSAATLTPVTARFVAVAPASVVPGVVTTTATPATLKAAAVPVLASGPAAVTLTPAVLRLTAVTIIWVTVDLDITIGPTRHLSRLEVDATRGTGTELTVAVTRLPHEIEVTRSRALTETSATRDRPRTTIGATRSRAQTDTGDTRQGIDVGPTRDGQEP